MVNSLAHIVIFGKPIIVYVGLLTLTLLLTTALVGFLNIKGIHAIPFKWHLRLAAATIIVALFHATLGLSLYFNF